MARSSTCPVALESFRQNPRGRVQVLLSLDEGSYEPGKDAMGDHPIIWCQDLEGGGRSFYSALGHTKESYSDPVHRRLLASAIAWAARHPPDAPSP